MAVAAQAAAGVEASDDKFELLLRERSRDVWELVRKVPPTAG
jgi:hypothetical protein